MSAKPCSEVPDVAADSWRHGACNLPEGHSGEHINGACHTWEQPAPRSLRLLPWTEPNGNPAYTPADGTYGMIARLADRMEREQLTTAADLLEHARAMLAVREPLTPEQARFVVMRLSEALSDTLRVAESRGMRLPGCADDE